MLGKEVNFVRWVQIKPTTNKKKSVWGVEIGKGIVLSHHLNADKRPQFQVAKNGDLKNVVNVEFKCINPSKDFIKKYEEYQNSIEDITQEFVKEQQSVVDKGNELLQQIHTSFLGEPFDLEVKTE